MVFYSQQDKKWSSQLLGYNTDKRYNLGSFGCLVTTWSNMLRDITSSDQYTPSYTNAWLKNHDGFLPGGGIMKWGSPLGLGFVAFDRIVGSIGEVADWTKDPGHYAVIEVKLKSGGQHFVLGHKSGLIIDAGDGKEKKITTYPFVRARLYRAVGGRGAAIPVTNRVEGDPIMTDTEEQEAYEIVLGRKREIAPTGRTGLQFIRDARKEISDRYNQWKADRAKLSELEKANTQLAEQVSVIRATTISKAEFLEATEVEHEATRVAKVAGQQVDFATGQEMKEFGMGTVFHQFSTFTVDNVTMVRTQKSKDNGYWYGTPESVFDPLPAIDISLSASEKAHLGASLAYARFSRLINKFKKETKKQ